MWKIRILSSQGWAILEIGTSASKSVAGGAGGWIGELKEHKIIKY